MCRDFGVGQMGDRGAHTMDLLWSAIDGSAPTTIETDQELSSPYDPNILPVKLKATFELPPNAWRGPVKVVWYRGGLKPNPPRNFMDMSRISNGAIFQGSKGVILADFNSRLIIPDNDAGDMTYYKRRTVPASGSNATRSRDQRTGSQRLPQANLPAGLDPERLTELRADCFRIDQSAGAAGCG
jgi:hypothetical protein